MVFLLIPYTLMIIFYPLWYLQRLGQSLEYVKIDIERRYVRVKKEIYPKNKDRKGNYGKYEIKT